jgi:hypothetical protein
MTGLQNLRALIVQGDMRTIGASKQVCAMIMEKPELMREAISLMGDSETGVAMRAADVVEKASRAHPELLVGYKLSLLELFHSSLQKEVVWHLLQLIPRLALTPDERVRTFRRAEQYLEGSSRIVAAEALSALFSLAAGRAQLQRKAVAAAKSGLRSPYPAVRARARKLLA